LNELELDVSNSCSIDFADLLAGEGYIEMKPGTLTKYMQKTLANPVS
jgi:hypothetical protein